MADIDNRLSSEFKNYKTQLNFVINQILSENYLPKNQGILILWLKQHIFNIDKLEANLFMLLIFFS